MLTITLIKFHKPDTRSLTLDRAWTLHHDPLEVEDGISANSSRFPNIAETEPPFDKIGGH
jgi:hypothetical protein